MKFTTGKKTLKNELVVKLLFIRILEKNVEECLDPIKENGFLNSIFTLFDQNKTAMALKIFKKMNRPFFKFNNF